MRSVPRGASLFVYYQRRVGNTVFYILLSGYYPKNLMGISWFAGLPGWLSDACKPRGLPETLKPKP